MTQKFKCPEECSASFRTRRWWNRHVVRKHGWTTISYELEDGEWDQVQEAMKLSGEDFQDFAYRAIKTHIEREQNGRI